MGKHWKQWLTLFFLAPKSLQMVITAMKLKDTYSGWEDPLEKGMASTLVLLPGKFHGWRSLVGYSPWGGKESDKTEQLHFTSLHFTLLLGRKVMTNLDIILKSRMHETSTQGWYTGMTQRDGMGREVGTGFRMRNTCKSMADSCQYMAKTTTIL